MDRIYVRVQVAEQLPDVNIFEHAYDILIDDARYADFEFVEIAEQIERDMAKALDQRYKRR